MRRRTTLTHGQPPLGRHGFTTIISFGGYITRSSRSSLSSQLPLDLINRCLSRSERIQARKVKGSDSEVDLPSAEVLGVSFALELEGDHAVELGFDGGLGFGGRGSDGLLDADESHRHTGGADVGSGIGALSGRVIDAGDEPL